MDIEARKYLTEKVLGECWHKTDRPTQRCLYCGMKLMYFNHHIFATRDDMMDLYEAIKKAGKWDDFDNYSWNYRKGVNPEISHTTWLFCLSGVGYEDRCQMVYEWWKEKENWREVKK